MWANLRSGNWVNEQRLKVYPLMLLVGAALVIMAMIAMTHDRLGPDDRPLGTDFSQVWIAGLETLRGHPEEPFDLVRHISGQHSEFGEKSAVYGWLYPPYFLAPAALLAHLSIQLLCRARALPMTGSFVSKLPFWCGIPVQTASTCLTTASLPHDFESAKWKKLLAIHLDGAFLATRAALRQMYKQNSGSIVYMGSVHSKEASVLKAPYVAAKHGLIGLVEDVAEVAPFFTAFKSDALTANRSSAAMAFGFHTAADVRRRSTSPSSAGLRQTARDRMERTRTMSKATTAGTTINAAIFPA